MSTYRGRPTALSKGSWSLSRSSSFISVALMSHDIMSITHFWRARLISYSSSWRKLQTSVAWFLKTRRVLLLLSWKSWESEERRSLKFCWSTKTTTRFVQKHKLKSEIASRTHGSVTSPRTVHCSGQVLDWRTTSSELHKSAKPPESKHPACFPAHFTSHHHPLGLVEPHVVQTTTEILDNYWKLFHCFVLFDDYLIKYLLFTLLLFCWRNIVQLVWLRSTILIRILVHLSTC